MEGGSKVKINLESPLDIKTSDMMSPVSQPKFQHNRQKFQGKCLPTSLRYEHDGWAAGWDVYQFKFEGLAIETNPKGFIVTKQSLDGRGAYSILIQKPITDVLADDIISFLYNGFTLFQKEGITHKEYNGTTNINGNFNGKSFTIKVESLTKQYSIAGTGFRMTVEVNDVGDYTFVIYDLDTLADFELKHLHHASSAKVQGADEFAQFIEQDGDKLVWQELQGSNIVEITGNTAMANGKPATGYKKTGHKHSVKFDGKYEQDVEVKFDLIEFTPAIRRFNATKLTKWIYNDILDARLELSEKCPFAQWDVRFAKFPRNLKGGVTTFFFGWLPYWYGISIILIAKKVDKSAIVAPSKYPDNELYVSKIVPEYPKKQLHEPYFYGLNLFPRLDKDKKGTVNCFIAYATVYVKETKIHVPGGTSIKKEEVTMDISQYDKTDVGTIEYSFNTYLNVFNDILRDRTYQQKIENQYEYNKGYFQGTTLKRVDDRETKRIPNKLRYSAKIGVLKAINIIIKEVKNNVKVSNLSGLYYNDNANPEYWLIIDNAKKDKLVFPIPDDFFEYVTVSGEIDADFIDMDGCARFLDRNGDATDGLPDTQVINNAILADIKAKITNVLDKLKTHKDYNTKFKPLLDNYKPMLKVHSSVVTLSIGHTQIVFKCLDGLLKGKKYVALHQRHRIDLVQVLDKNGKALFGNDIILKNNLKINPFYESGKLDNKRIVFAGCIKGYFQTTVTGEDLFMEDNLNNKIKYRASTDAELINEKAFYIDRKTYKIDGISASEKCISCQFDTQEMGTLQGYSATFTLVEEPEFTVFAPVIKQEATKDGIKIEVPDFFMPNHILNGDLSYLNLTSEPKKEDKEKGILFGNLIANRLYSEDISRQFKIKVTGKIKLVNKIIGVEFYWANKGLAGHDFYDNTLKRWQEEVKAELENVNGNFVPKLKNNTYKDITHEFDEDDIFSSAQKVKLHIAGQVFNLTYVLHENEIKLDKEKDITDGIYKGKIKLINDEDINIKIPIKYKVTVPLVFDITMYEPYVDNPDVKILAYKDGLYTLLYELRNQKFTVDLTKSELNYVTWTDKLVKGIDAEGQDTYRAKIDYIDFLTLVGKVKGIFGDVLKLDSSVTDAKIKSYNGNIIIIEVNGKEYTIDISENGVMNPDSVTNMLFKVTDTRDENLTQRTIAKQDASTEFQFLKQQWCTTEEVENYWWIDNKHILELNEFDFVLKRKTSKLDDWGGDVFEVVKTFQRAKYLLNDVYKYGCTNVYGNVTALFYTVSVLQGNKILLAFYNPLDNMSVKQLQLEIGYKKLGDVLNTDRQKLFTYTDITAMTIATFGQFSATCVDNNILFGIHYNNNFNQWALKINRQSLQYSVLHGYGFVGVNGCLTGGEIPTKYFNYGFSSIVYPLDVLKGDNILTTKLAPFYDFSERVVGTAEQQWYIDKHITGIVSHLEFIKGEWVAMELPISSKLSQIYGSPSFASRTITDASPFRKRFANLLSAGNDSGADPVSAAMNGIFQGITVALADPAIWGFNPKFNTVMYLQQTLGQYAYVHYNSTSIVQQVEQDDSGENGAAKDDPVSSDEITFNKVTITQSCCVKKAWVSILAMCVQALISGATFVSEKLQANVHENQTTTSDKGRKFSQIFISNMDAMVSTDTNVIGSLPVVNSKVSGLLTLDMFYSTSDKQQISAGSGYVNHNFQAQCVAQSVTSNQFELNQITFLLIMSGFTIAEAEAKMRALQITADGLTWLADKIAQTEPPKAMGSGPGGIVYTGPAIAIQAGAKILYGTIAAQKVALEKMIKPLLDAVYADKLQTSVSARQTKHTYKLEGKHKYGTKSECFMWPCFGINNPLDFTDETADATLVNNAWTFDVDPYSGDALANIAFFFGSVNIDGKENITVQVPRHIKLDWSGKVPYLIAQLVGNTQTRKLPNDMAAVIGADSFLSKVPFRNENVGASEPVFPTPPFQDYIIDKVWKLSKTASAGMTVWVSCKDTKLLDGEPSNIIVSPSFCGVACPYTAIEVKRGIGRRYMRPWAITPTALGLNNTGFNCCFEKKAYHAFDGYGYRTVKWVGSPGMIKERQTWQYSFIANDRFKRSNKMPLNEFIGNFKSNPIMATETTGEDRVFTLVTKPGENEGIQAGTIGEDKDVRRYALPVFSEFVSTLPAVVKTISAYNLSVVDGITSLTSENRDLQTAYKAPISIDFAIGKNMYRYTKEYICSLEQTSGVSVVKDIVPCLGLNFIGSTPYEAYLYSPATRQYYTFSGGSSLNMVDMIERFRNVTAGRYDFVNQEVLMPCLATFMRLDRHVEDDENETDNLMIPRLKDGNFIGEIWPPTENIFNTRSWFRTISLPMGIVYQGPNRCVINRFVLSDYMVKSIKENYGKWQRIPREEYHPFRQYKAIYKSVEKDIGRQLQIKGWTHNPFLLVTAPLGVDNESDCIFEWEITFCWPVEMDKLYGVDSYATVNVQAETMTPGGKVVAERPTHIYLHKELFTRTGNYGYYSFRYQSKNGIGNRERLHIWSDQYIAVSGLQCEYKVMTTKRTEILTQQVDVQHLKEI